MPVAAAEHAPRARRASERADVELRRLELAGGASERTRSAPCHGRRLRWRSVRASALGNSESNRLAGAGREVLRPRGESGHSSERSGSGRPTRGRLQQVELAACHTALLVGTAEIDGHRVCSLRDKQAAISSEQGVSRRSLQSVQRTLACNGQPAPCGESHAPSARRPPTWPCASQLGTRLAKTCSCSAQRSAAAAERASTHSARRPCRTEHPWRR